MIVNYVHLICIYLKGGTILRYGNIYITLDFEWHLLCFKIYIYIIISTLFYLDTVFFIYLCFYLIFYVIVFLLLFPFNWF